MYLMTLCSSSSVKLPHRKSMSVSEHIQLQSKIMLWCLMRLELKKIGCRLVAKLKGSTSISALYINDIAKVMLREMLFPKQLSWAKNGFYFVRIRSL